MKYAVGFDYGREIQPAIISTHRTLEAAEKAIARTVKRQRAIPGQQNTGTWLRVYRLEVNEDRELAIAGDQAWVEV